MQQGIPFQLPNAVMGEVISTLRVTHDSCAVLLLITVMLFRCYMIFAVTNTTRCADSGALEAHGAWTCLETTQTVCRTRTDRVDRLSSKGYNFKYALEDILLAS